MHISYKRHRFRRPCGVALLPVPFEPAPGRGELPECWIVVSYKAIAGGGRSSAPSLRSTNCAGSGRAPMMFGSSIRTDMFSRPRLLTRLLKKQGLAPKRIITDKLRSYGAAKRQVMPDVEHRAQRGLNNRAESSHVPLRKRERTMQGFRSPGGWQRFARSSQPSVVSSSQPAQNAPHSRSISITWKAVIPALA